MDGDSYGIHFSPGRLHTLCELEWSSFKVGWLPEESLVQAARSVWDVVSNPLGHTQSVPLHRSLAIHFFHTLAWLKTCALSLGARVLLIRPEHSEKLKVLQVPSALPEEADSSLFYVLTGPVGNLRGLEEIVLPRGEARGPTLVYLAPSVPRVELATLPMKRPGRHCLRLQDHCSFSP